VLHAFPRPVEQRVEGLTLVALEVLLRRPVVRLEAGYVRAPFEVVAQVVRERLPSLGAPVEVAEPRQGRERAVIQDGPRLQIGPVAAPFERDALTQRVDVAAARMRHDLGSHFDCHYTVRELCGHLAGETVDHHAKVIEPHPFPFPGAVHPARCTARYATRRSAATRSCFSVSRSRTVTVPSAVDWPSMVMPNGVPASSCRR